MEKGTEHETLRKALASAAYLIGKDPDLEGVDTLDDIESDLYAATTALEVIRDVIDRALNQGEKGD